MTDRIKELEAQVKELEAHRIRMRKVFWDGVDASAKSWFKEYKRRQKAERERNSLQRRLDMLLHKPKPIRRKK